MKRETVDIFVFIWVDKEANVLGAYFTTISIVEKNVVALTVGAEDMRVVLRDRTIV